MSKVLSDWGYDTINNIFVIAEIGINHGGKLDTAKRLIDSAAKTGVDAVKFQTYITEKRVPRSSPIFSVLKECELPFEAFSELREHATYKGVQFFSTPFDIDSVDYLDEIGVNLFKIASFDTVNQELLRKISEKRKPVVMSVGMSDLAEIRNAYNILKSGTKGITLMHCISSYPTREEDANLSCLTTLRDNFDCVVGQSDHTSDIQVPLFAVIAGAQVIEKHYRIDTSMECIDAPVSITEQQLRKLITEIRRVERIFGSSKVGVKNSEKDSLQFRRPTN